MYKVSIIIPVYNVDEYLPRCIDSVLNQDNVKLEVLLVNDGSTDRSGEICDEYSKKDERIKVFHQANGGVSSARNKGIQVAKGEYIIFVDSDDIIKENSLKKIINYLDKYQSQLTILNSIIEEKGVVIERHYIYPKYFSDKTISGVELFQNQYLKASVCGVVFNTQFILNNKLLFSEEIANSEDTLFMSMTFLYATSIRHLDLDFYFITLREGSASRLWNYKKVEKMLDSLKVINEFIKTNSLTNEQLAILNIRAYGTISNTMYQFFNLNSLKGYFRLKNIIAKSPLYPIETYGAEHFKKKITLLNFSFDLFCIPFFLRGLYIKFKNNLL